MAILSLLAVLLPCFIVDRKFLIFQTEELSHADKLKIKPIRVLISEILETYFFTDLLRVLCFKNLQSHVVLKAYNQSVEGHIIVSLFDSFASGVHLRDIIQSLHYQNDQR